MEGPRSPLEKEYPKVLSFLNENLRENVSWSIAEEYPTALNLANINNTRVIIDDEHIVSHAVVKPLIVKTPLLLLKVAAIGSVITNENYRSQGHSRKVLEDCIKIATDQGCDIAVLWTHLYDFYRKLGFELAGSEIRLDVHSPLNVEKLPLKIIKGGQIDPEAIFNLYQQHRVTTLRTLPEMKKFMQIPNSQIYTAWDPAGKIVAYAIEGKGADLKGYIHEWGGSVKPLMNLINAIQAELKSTVSLITPSHSTNLIQKMQEAGALTADGFLGMFQILKPEQICGKIKRVARYLGIQDLVFERHDNLFYIGTAGKVFKTDSISDITKLIFGPYKPKDLYPFDDYTLQIFDKIFPLQFWLWGWDSI